MREREFFLGKAERRWGETADAERQIIGKAERIWTNNEMFAMIEIQIKRRCDHE
jgi:hypothetical protein